MISDFKPKDYQPDFNWQDYIQKFKASDTKLGADQQINVDVLFVGAGPAGLSGAVHLKTLCKKDFPDIQIAVLEKASRVGGHSLSGAVINPKSFKKLFPEIPENQMPFHCKIKKEKLFYLTQNKKYLLPLPPPMKNKDFYTASLCEVLRWMEEKAAALDVDIFTSTAVEKLLVDEEDKVIGVSTCPSGLNKEGKPSSSYQAPIYIFAKTVVLAEGSRGHLSKAWRRWKNISSKYPETYALGVKEIWETPAPLPQNTVWHSMGWPLPKGVFGGSWLYPLKGNKVSLGLVAGLDSSFKNLDVHIKLQELKQHPFFANILKKGRVVEWGAKTIPEGGFYSMPEQLYDNGLLIAGDCAGMVNVPALKGIHYAMEAGMLCAQTFFKALKANDFSHSVLKTYHEQVTQKSLIAKELYPVRNVRQAFNGGFLTGLIKSGLMFLTKGFFPGDFSVKNLKKDSEENRSKTETSRQNTEKFLSKVNAVYLSGNKTRDDIPPHLKTKKDLPKEVIKFYEHLCPAGVYEEKEGRFIINAPNCIDCKATDVLGPRWTPKEGAAGPNYQQM